MQVSGQAGLPIERGRQDRQNHGWQNHGNRSLTSRPVPGIVGERYEEYGKGRLSPIK
jgi:hypothetical protein